jgi:hypothetical protein
MCSNLSFKLLVSKLFPQFSLRALKKVIHEEEYKKLFHCVTQFCRVSSLYFFLFSFFFYFSTNSFMIFPSLPPLVHLLTHRSSHTIVNKKQKPLFAIYCNTQMATRSLFCFSLLSWLSFHFLCLCFSFLCISLSSFSVSILLCSFLYFFSPHWLSLFSLSVFFSFSLADV